MAFNSKNIATCVSILIFPVALISFAVGFFPYKPLLPGLAVFDENVPRPAPVFDKVILMVVDALRSDFVYSNRSGFHFTQGLIRDGAALPYTAYASAPTVTMPRVKAITSGSMPSFADVILNIAESDSSSTLANQDTWLAQIKAQPGGKLVLYGDDTWLRLFPGMFERHDGTTSFFVSDFYEVDKNVTRNIPGELQNDDWSAMIMHYLGLDHIGHKAGAFSRHMVPKQREMDSMVKQIYDAMEKENHLSSTLLVLCGDHGMTDAGNHGGASPGETLPALTFISPKLRQLQKSSPCPTTPSQDLEYYQLVEQSDIAPTLAGLLGFPVPLNNLGVFIPDFLDMWPRGAERLQILMDNAKQILKIVKSAYPKFVQRSTQFCIENEQNTDLLLLECKWQEASRLALEANEKTALLANAELALIDFCRTAQRIMSSASSNYNLSMLYTGTGIAGAAVLLILAALLASPLKLSGAMKYFSFVTLSYSILMFASSYVEEEQQFWYWALTGWTCYLYIRTRHKPTGSELSNPLILAALCRVVRRWNQTGQKFTTEPDIASTFFTTYPSVLWILVLLTYTDVYQRLKPQVPPKSQSGVISTLYLPLTSFAFIYKAAFTSADSPELIETTPLLASLVRSVQSLSLVFQARLVFLGLAATFLFNLYVKVKLSSGRSGRTSWSSIFHPFLTLFLLTQSRATNIPLFGIFQLQYDALLSMDLPNTEIGITALLFQYSTFFAFGGSNAISSIDLSNAYNGISGYNAILVGILTFVGNWAGPIWWVSATHCMLRHKRKNSTVQTDTHIQIWSLFTAASLLAVMVACTVLRAHLFIWSVFSPKYLYSAGWTLGQHIGINIVFGEVLLKWLYN